MPARANIQSSQQLPGFSMATARRGDRLGTGRPEEGNGEWIHPSPQIEAAGGSQRKARRRPRSASPAERSAVRHASNQQIIVDKAFVSPGGITAEEEGKAGPALRCKGMSAMEREREMESAAHWRSSPFGNFSIFDSALEREAIKLCGALVVPEVAVDRRRACRKWLKKEATRSCGDPCRDRDRQIDLEGRGNPPACSARSRTRLGGVKSATSWALRGSAAARAARPPRRRVGGR